MTIVPSPGSFPEDVNTHDQPRERITQLQSLEEAAGRDPIPVAIFGPAPDLDHWKRLSELGVHRLVLYIPSADRDTIMRALDDHALMINALGT